MIRQQKKREKRQFDKSKVFNSVVRGGANLQNNKNYNYSIQDSDY